MAGDERNEEWFRGLLDADGVLLPEAKLRLDVDSSFRVFSQDSAPKIRSSMWGTFATRFCDTRLGITTDKHYGVRDIARDAARVVLTREGLRATLLVLVRHASDADVVAAEAAERAAGTYGLALLAKRCKSLFIIETHGGATSTDGGSQSEASRAELTVGCGGTPRRESDRAALLLSAILAGTELGPVVYPGATDLVGFKTAWSRFQATGAVAPYR